MTPVSSAWHYVTRDRERGSRRRATCASRDSTSGTGICSRPTRQDDPARRGDEFFVVNGDSYGADVLLRQFERGPFSGWISYTYAVATRNANGASLLPRTRPAARLQLRRELAALEVSARRAVRLRDGNAVHRHRGRDRAARSTIRDSTRTARAAAESRPSSSAARATARGLPTTQRLDLDVTRRYRVRGMTIAPYLSVVNAYNAKNVFLYVFDYSDEPADAPGDLTVPSAPVGRCLDSLLGRVPVAMLAALVVAASCELSTVTVPPTTPTVVVHAVLNPSAATQVVLLERTLTGAVARSGSRSFDPDDPIVERGRNSDHRRARRDHRLDAARG